MKVDIAPVSRPKLVRDATVESIRDAIIYGRLQPGTRLVERELCEATGASRTSVREAIRQLEADRLVVVTAHKGPAVAKLTREQAAEIYALRADLEVRLSVAFRRNATPGDVEVLRAMLPEIETAADAADKAALVGIMNRFNGHIMEVSGLGVTSDLLRTLLARISWLRVLSMTQPGRIADSVAEIAEIVDVIGSGRPRDIERAVRRYVSNAGAAALKQIDAV